MVRWHRRYGGTRSLGRLPRGASISPRHPDREARPPDRRLRTPRGSSPPARRRSGGAAARTRRPSRIVHRRLPSFSGPRTGKPGRPNLLSGGPKPSGGRQRSSRDPPLFGTGKPAPGDGFRERLVAPAAKPRSSLRARLRQADSTGVCFRTNPEAPKTPSDVCRLSAIPGSLVVRRDRRPRGPSGSNTTGVRSSRERTEGRTHPGGRVSGRGGDVPAEADVPRASLPAEAVGFAYPEPSVRTAGPAGRFQEGHNRELHPTFALPGSRALCVFGDTEHRGGNPTRRLVRIDRHSRRRGGSARGLAGLARRPSPHPFGEARGSAASGAGGEPPTPAGRIPNTEPKPRVRVTSRHFSLARPEGRASNLRF